MHDTTDSPQASVTRPPIEPIPKENGRPFWSVMITAYDRLDFLQLALSSVLKQAPAAEEMQIEVLNDGATPEIQDQLEELVRQVAGDRVSFYRHPVNVGGGPRFSNVCIERARGHWVHILHDDDLVRPGFYEAMRKGITAAPQVGMAFCRHIFMVGNKGTYSEAERETAGVLENWLERIGWNCKTQFAALVVKRSVYEAVGGFSPQLRGASDWEMWQRIAVHYPVWYEPEPLACYRQHDNSLTGFLGRSGEHTAAVRRVIEAIHDYFREHISPEFADRITPMARSYYGQYALSFADRFLRDKNYQAALINLQEAATCCPTPAMQERVGRFFSAKPKYHRGTVHEVEIVGDSDHEAYWSSITSGERQPEIYRILNEHLKPEHTCCDIGAGLGGTTVFAGKKCRRVFAIEPDTVAYQNLLLNLRLNGLTHVVPFQIAVGDKTGLQPVPVRGRVGETRPVALPMLAKSMAWTDWISLFEIEQLDFIHLDIEGREPYLLGAMESYLAKHAPTLLVSTYGPRLPADQRPQAMSQVARVLAHYRICYNERLEEVDLASLATEGGCNRQQHLLAMNA